MDRRYDIRLNSLLLHTSKARDPYDGEVWAWSPLEQNQVAYIDGKGDLWMANADGGNPERLLKGNFLLPAWSLDGTAIAVVERNAAKKRWDVFVVTVPRPVRSREFLVLDSVKPVHISVFANDPQPSAFSVLVEALT